jgi:hypothetical protein
MAMMDAEPFSYLGRHGEHFFRERAEHEKNEPKSGNIWASVRSGTPVVT